MPIAITLQAFDETYDSRFGLIGSEATMVQAAATLRHALRFAPQHVFAFSTGVLQLQIDSREGIGSPLIR